MTTRGPHVGQACTLQPAHRSSPKSPARSCRAMLIPSTFPHTPDDQVDLRYGTSGRLDGLASPAGRARHEGTGSPPESAGRGRGQAEHRHDVHYRLLEGLNVLGRIRRWGHETLDRDLLGTGQADRNSILNVGKHGMACCRQTWSRSDVWKGSFSSALKRVEHCLHRERS